MEDTTLELNIISAMDLNDVNRFTTMSVYCLLSLSGVSVLPQTATTHVHKKGGTSPTWNFSTTFPFNESLAQQNRLSLEVELISDRFARHTTIGTVHIPLKELLENPAADDSLRQVSYQVRKPSGMAKGILNISYKFSKRVMPGTAEESSSVPSGTAYPPPQPGHGYPPQPGQNPQQKKKKNKLGKVLQAAGVLGVDDAVGAGAATAIDEIFSDNGDDDA